MLAQSQFKFEVNAHLFWKVPEGKSCKSKDGSYREGKLHHQSLTALAMESSHHLIACKSVLQFRKFQQLEISGLLMKNKETLDDGFIVRF